MLDPHVCILCGHSLLPFHPQVDGHTSLSLLICIGLSTVDSIGRMLTTSDMHLDGQEWAWRSQNWTVMELRMNLHLLADTQWFLCLQTSACLTCLVAEVSGGQVFFSLDAMILPVKSRRFYLIPGKAGTFFFFQLKSGEIWGAFCTVGVSCWILLLSRFSYNIWPFYRGFHGANQLTFFKSRVERKEKNIWVVAWPSENSLGGS